MKKKLLAKKTLSVFMAVMMLMSCWVFVPAEHNHAGAIDAGDSVAEYNKELLGQINTTVDTNMDKAYGKFLIAGNGDNGGSYTTERAKKSYVNVLYSPTVSNTGDLTKATGAVFTGVTNTDRVAVWYPTTVLMYDGAASRMAVLLEIDASKGGQTRAVSCWMSANKNGLEFDGSYQAGSNTGNENHWKGLTDNGDSAHAYIMYDDADKYQVSADGTDSTAYKMNYAKDKWYFLGGHLKFTGTLSDTEWVREIKPTWKYWGGNTKNPGQYTGSTSSTIYVMNIQGYKRLVQDIISKKGSLNGKEGQYTRDSLQRFVNACNKITKDLAPKTFVSTTSNRVAEWNTEMQTAYSEYTAAYKALTPRNVNVGYENLFSISDWAASESANLQSSSTVEIKVEDNNAIKIYKNAAGGEVYTTSSYSGDHKATMYSIPVTGGKDYTVRFNITSSVNGAPTSDVFLFWYDVNNKPLKNTAGGDTFNTQRFNDNGLKTVTFTAPTNAAKAEIRFDNDSASAGSTIWFNDIAVYPAERNTAVEVDTWSTRPITKTVQYGTTLSGKLDVPVRNGYTFNGWYIDNVNVNGVKDSGEEVTDAAGNVTRSVTVTDSINLYADWKPLPMDIGYDNIFSLAEWAKTGSTKASSANGTIAYDVMAGTITAESTANGEVYNVYGTGSDQYVITVKPNTEYIFEADMDLVTGDKGQMFVFFYNASGSGVSGAIYNGTAQTNAHIGIYPTTEGTSSITFTTPADCTKMAFRVGATNVGTKAVYSNIGFYKKADYDAYAKDYATIRVPFNFGDTTDLALVPTREGYQFDGWYTANGTKLTSVTGLKASDTVYAKWTQLFKVTFKNWDGTVLKTQNVAPNAAATAPQNPNRAADKDYEYTFDKWDTDFSKVTTDLVVTATFKSKDHTGISKTYQSGATCTKAATYTQLCTVCGFVWTEEFEDPAMPALGHTWERENPSFTVVTDKGTETGHTVKCNACDATTIKAHDYKLDANHPASEATCVVVGETYYKCACLREKTEIGTTNPNKHVNTVIINKKDAKCGEEGYTGDTYCNDCKKTVETGTVIKALEHKYTNYVYNEDATCTADGTKTATCDNGCGTKDTVKAEGTMIPHSFTKYVSNGDATCDADGTKNAKCDYNCGKTDTVTDTGSKRAHKFDGTVKNNEDGTHSFECSYDDCAVYGGTVDCGYGAWKKDDAATHSHTCTTCGYTPAAEGHDWGDGWKTVGGTGTSEATQTRLCKVCGRVENTKCNYQEVEAEHKDATCETPERITYKCSDCGHGYTVNGEAAKGHKFDKEAGVYSDGEGNHAYYCSNNCGEYGIGEEKNETVKCSDWTYANTEAGKHTATCDDCGYVKTENCSGGEATCTAKAVCQFCNTAYGELADHNYNGDTYFEGVEKAKDATCTAQAEYYTYCSACKKSSKGTDKEATFAYGDLLAHTFTGDTEFLYKATDAKCEVNETYYVYCSECKASSEGTAEEATFEKADTALKHVWVNAQHNADTLTHTFTCERGCGKTMTANCADAAVSYGYEPATCTEQGYDIVQCSACGHQWNINYTAALGHDYTQKIYDEAHLKSAANCEQANVYYYDCSRCDKNAKNETDTEKYTTLTYTSGEVRKHDFHNKVDAKYLANPATCFAAAKYFTSCKYENCGKSSEDVYGVGKGTKFSSGTALAHNWTEVEDAKYLATEADCANDATYYYECSLCKNSSKDYGDGATWTDVDSKSGHSMTYTAAKKATCYEAGNLEYWYCDTCKKYYKDAEGKDAYLGQSETVIKKREHDLATFSYKAATCEEDGHPAYVDCKYEDCDYTTLPAVLPNGYKATGHNFTGALVADKDNLYHSRLCANGCGVSGMVDDGEQVKYEVTFNGEDEAVIVGGVKCEFTYTESTKNGVHSHANACVCGNNNSKTYTDEETFVKTVAPTCTAKGYDSYACKDCGATWTKNEKPATGHTAAEKATSNGDGTHSIKCTVKGCGYVISTEKCSGGQATCSEKAKCKVCDGLYGETGDHVYAEGSEWVYQNDAKCGVNGTEKNFCTACKKKITREAEGTALKHDMTEFGYEVPKKLADKLAADGIEIKEPTCGASGLALSYCKNCDKYETKSTPRNKDAHIWETDANGELVWTANGTCGTGVTLTNKCTVCDAVQTKTGSAEHEWIIVTDVKATCKEAAHQFVRCSVCSTTDDIHVADALGHSWEREGANQELVVDKKATCANTGRGHYVCTDCNEKSDSVTIEKLPHTWDDPDEYIFVEAAAPTCEKFGHEGYHKCLECSYDESEDPEWIAKYIDNEEFKALGHDDADGDGKCDSCNKTVGGGSEKPSEGKCGCICHKESGFMKFIYKIIRFFWKLFGIGKTCECGTVHY